MLHYSATQKVTTFDSSAIAFLLCPGQANFIASGSGHLLIVCRMTYFEMVLLVVLLIGVASSLGSPPLARVVHCFGILCTTL